MNTKKIGPPLALAPMLSFLLLFQLSLRHESVMVFGICLLSLVCTNPTFIPPCSRRTPSRPVGTQSILGKSADKCNKRKRERESHHADSFAEKTRKKVLWDWRTGVPGRFRVIVLKMLCQPRTRSLIVVRGESADNSIGFVMVLAAC